MTQASNYQHVVHMPINEFCAKFPLTRIGAAWRNKKNGFGLRLDALPVNSEIVLLPPKEDEDKLEDAA